LNLGQSEVQNLYRAVGLDLDVAGLQIAMCDALLVRGFERVTYLRCDSQSFIKRHRPFGRLALDKLHHQIIRADVVNLADVGMIQRGDRFGFTLETLRELRG
jgi:hypothetical protein